VDVTTDPSYAQVQVVVSDDVSGATDGYITISSPTGADLASNIIYLENM
jgi:hypothetical protein